MSESFKNKRVIFKKHGDQSSWFDELSKETTVRELAELCSCSERTIRDWRREKFCINYGCLILICDRYKIKRPDVEVRSKFEHLSEAGRKEVKHL